MEIIGAVAGLLTVMTYAPQAIKTIHTRKTRDLSLATYLILTTGAVCWTVYGLAKNLPSIWVANGIVSVLAITILTIKLKEKKAAVKL